MTGLLKKLTAPINYNDKVTLQSTYYQKYWPQGGFLQLDGETYYDCLEKGWVRNFSLLIQTPRDDFEGTTLPAQKFSELCPHGTVMSRQSLPKLSPK